MPGKRFTVSRTAAKTSTIELVEAAARLRVAYHVAHRWALTGHLKAERRDGRWWADAADTERLANELSSRAKLGDR